MKEWSAGATDLKTWCACYREWDKTKFKTSRLLEIGPNLMKAYNFLIFAKVRPAATLRIYASKYSIMVGQQALTGVKVLSTLFSKQSQTMASAGAYGLLLPC